jgi:hypothetical protein
VQHYERKAKADEIALARYIDSTAAALRATPLPAINIPADQPLDAASRTDLEAWVKTQVEPTLDAFHAARIAAQQAADTPEEMERLAQACTKAT